MKVLGFVFLGICLIGLGIIAVKFGWYDFIVKWINGMVK